MLGSIFPNTDFAQLLHLPEAWLHYLDHAREAAESHEEFSLWTFLNDHYQDPEGHTHDNSSHDHLPFQHFHASIEMVHISINLFQDCRRIPYALRPTFHLQRLYSTDVYRGIYRPPIEKA
jgi:hypothetical protein